MKTFKNAAGNKVVEIDDMPTYAEVRNDTGTVWIEQGTDLVILTKKEIKQLAEKVKPFKKTSLFLKIGIVATKLYLSRKEAQKEQVEEAPVDHEKYQAAEEKQSNFNALYLDPKAISKNMKESMEVLQDLERQVKNWKL